MRKILFTTLFLTLVSSLMWAQSKTQNIEIEVQETFAEHLGTIPAIRELIPLSTTSPEKRKQSKLSKQAPKNFQGRGKNTVLYPERQNIGPDPIRQSSFDRSMGLTIEPLVNEEGLFNSFGSPHDPSGDIGRDHYVQGINATEIGVFDKEGNLLQTFAGNTLWATLGLSSAGDPIILYDQEVDRWIITEFPDPNFLLVAVSKTSDPLGEYDAWSFATPSFPDYPKYGIWNNAYSVTTNEGGPGTLHTYFINREAMLAGDASVPIQRISLPGSDNTEAGFFVATPVDWSGFAEPNSDPLILALNDSSWGNVAEDAIEMYAINIDWDDPNNTTASNTSIPVSPYDSYACASAGYGFACVPQMGGGGLDGIPETIMNQSHYRNFGSHESIVLNFMTDVDGNELSGIRWMELRRMPGAEWEVYQEGTFAPSDGLHRFMGGIAMDGAGNIGLAYNVSSASSFVGIRFTGRRAGDPLGEMTVDEYNVVDGVNTINSGSRFGDYGHMSIDPTNDRTFWYTTEYAAGGNSRTRIIAFELRRDTIDLAPTTLNSPQNSPDLTDSEVVRVVVKNQGLDTIQNFDVGYIFQGGVAVSDNVTFTLYPDSSYLHTFTPTVDLSIVGDYQFTLFTDLTDDQAIFNDTLRRVVSKLPRWDAGISEIKGGDSNICGESADFNFTLTNFAGATLNDVTIEIQLNGGLFQTIPWTGTLLPGESVDVSVTITGLIDGSNAIMATTSNPNGMMDERTGNDSSSKTVEVILDGTLVILTINTDEYPEETTWQLIEPGGSIIDAGGPYAGQANSTITVEWCLDPDLCYTFNIFDSVGDGICCGYGQGDYNISDGDGNVLLNGDGDFGDQASDEFCLDGGCSLAIELDISNVTVTGANDGAIMITANNGVAPYEYSIDGGATYQSSNIFDNLPAGDYQVVVKDANDCESVATTATVGIDINDAVNDIDANISVKVHPNPTSGVFRIEATGIDQASTFLRLGMFDQQGKVVYNSRIARYDDAYTGMLSLYAFPSGIYFLKIYNEDGKGIGRLIRIVKI